MGNGLRTMCHEFCAGYEDHFRFGDDSPAIASDSLAAMNWRRGLVLALPMILMMETRDQK